MSRINRNTKQKETIKTEIEQIEVLFNADELFERLQKIDHKIGKATIYRYLKDAEKEKKLYTYTCDRKKIYSKENKSHCHFKCEKTGKIIHFELDNLDFIKNKIPGSITSFQLEVKGICNNCCNINNK